MYNPLMFRRWIVLVLLVLQLQPALAFVPEHVGPVAKEFAHSTAHQAGLGHRHDDASGFQLDDDSPATHAHHDAGHHSALLLPNKGWLPTLPKQECLMSFSLGQLPDPCLDGPLRPPRPLV